MVEEKGTAPKYKVINGKRVPLCDYQGKCLNKAYKEVYRLILNGDSSWSYLCKKHFEQEKKRFKGKLTYCSIVD